MDNRDFDQNPEETINLKELLFQYLRHWPWFILALLLCGGGAWLYLQRATPMYQVTSLLLITDEKKGAGMAGNAVLSDLDVFSGSKIVDNEIEVLKSRALIEKVVDELNLTVRYYEEGTFRDKELYEKSPIRVNYSELNPYAYENPAYIRPLDEQRFELLSAEKGVLGTFIYTQAIKSTYGAFRVFRNPEVEGTDQTIKLVFNSREGVIDGLRRDISVSLANKNSTVLTLNYLSAVPDKGKAVLAKLLDVYTFSALEYKNREATNTLRFIEERLKLVTGELSDVEKDVEQYKSTAGITDLSAESNLFLEKVKDNDVKLSELDIQIKVLEGVEKYVDSDQGMTVAPATLMVTDPVLTSHIESLSSLELQKEKVSRGARSSNPFLETINTQIANTKQAIKENLANQKQTLAITRAGLQNNNSRLEGAIRSIPRKEREIVGIQRQQNIKENLYMILLQKREETALSYASTVTDSRVVDMPNSSALPVSPKKNIIYLAALLLGVLIPAGYVYAKDLLIDTVQSKKEIEQKTGVTVFGEIALREKRNKSNFLAPTDRSFIAEQFRTLRTNLQYLNLNEKNPKGMTLLMTSSMSGEGKTFVSLNLATSLAALGKKVLLMELDLRKPRMSQYMGIASDKGVTQYLTGRHSEEEIFTPTEVENLYLVSSGPIPPNPLELLSLDRMQELIGIYKESFDYLILDMPPVGLVSDATVLAPLADVCFYLVRHEVTPQHNLKLLADLAKSKRFRSLNVIFNGVNYKNSKEYGYGYGSYYGYGTYWYGEKKKKWWKLG